MNDVDPGKKLVGASWIHLYKQPQKRWGEHCEERGRALDRKNDVTRLYAKVRTVKSVAEVCVWV